MFRSRRASSLSAFCLSLFLAMTTASAVDLNPATHQQIPGDFNGDGRMDALLQPLDEATQGALVLQDGQGNLSVVAQSWNPGYLGLDWSVGKTWLTAADLNGDGQDDVLAQPVSSGNNAAVLITDPSIQLLSVAQVIPVNYLGLDWSTAAHFAVAGDFDGDRHKEILLQAQNPGDLSAIVHADTTGRLVMISQNLPQGWLGRRWDAQDVTLYVGDFNGDGRQDLLIQVNPGEAKTGESAYALLLADGNGQFTQVNETWNLNDFGADWNPATHRLVVQDANGDGIADIVLQSRDPKGTNYVFLGNAQGTFTQPAAKWVGTKSAHEVLAAQHGTSNGISVVTTSSTTSHSATSNSSSLSSGSMMTTLSAPSGNQDTPGTLEGAGGVSGGTATYSIPIVVPPGRAGMQPTLALGYTSRGGNGVAGMGWSLSGLSAVHRCPATKAQDNYSRGVNYDHNDRFCLDGQHLLLWPSQSTGSYGQDGSVYRTELDTFARVELHGDSNSSTSYFVVHYKGNKTAYYKTPFIPAGAPAPLEWQISWEQDPAGNDITYTYDQTKPGESLIQAINYTGLATSSGPSSTGTRAVTFTYQTRPDMSTSYLAGGRSTQTRLLASVTTTENSQTVRTYQLGYSSSGATGRSLLSSVLGCGYGTDGVQHCFLQPTSFSWQNNAQTYQLQPYFVPDNDANGGNTPGSGDDQPSLEIGGDYDGDGHRELIYDRPGVGTLVYFVKGDGNLDQTKGNQGMVDIGFLNNGTTFNLINIFDKDMNNNGAADLLVDDMSSNRLAVSTWNGSTFSAPQDTNVKYSPFIMITDVNGDGLNDVLTKEQDSTNHHWYLCLYTNQSPRTFTFNTRIELNDLTNMGNNYFGQPIDQSDDIKLAGDLNGDGVQDIFLEGQGYIDRVLLSQVATDGSVTYSVQTAASIGITDTEQGFGSPTASQNHYFMDINGDGLPDLVFMSGSSDTWFYALNTGNQFLPAVDTGVGDGRFINGTAQIGAMNTLQGDVENIGVDELIFPVTRKVGYCPMEQVTIEGHKGSANDCPGPAPSGQDPSTYTLDSVAPQQDFSIFAYGTLKFVMQANGNYTAVENDNTGIIAQAGLTKLGDLQGDGLMDIFSPFSHWWADARFENAAGLPINACPVNYGCGMQASSNVNAAADTRLDAAPDMMLSATNGLGVVSSWDYYPLSSTLGFYTVPSVTSGNRYAADDYFYFNSSMYTVGEYRESNGIGGNATHDFHYNQAIYNNQGRGFQGFQSVVDDNLVTGARSVQLYHQRFPLSGQLAESWVQPTSEPGFSFTNPVLPADGHYVEHVINTGACFVGSGTRKFVGGSYTVDSTADPVTCTVTLDAPTYWPYVTTSEVVKQDTSWNSLSDSVSDPSYDKYGNYLSGTTTTTDVSGTYTQSTVDVYAAFDTTSNWWVDKLTNKTVTDGVTYNADDQGSAEAQPAGTTDYVYYPDGGNGARLPNTVTEMQADASHKRVTTYIYDTYDNPTKVTVNGGVSGADSYVAARSTTTAYTPDGYFPYIVTNAAGQSTTIDTYPQFGEPQDTQDPNTVTTDYGYDAFGRKISTQVMSPVSLPAQTVQYNSCDSSCPAYGAFYTITSQAGFPTHTSYIDQLARVIRTATDGFGGTAGDTIYQDTKYDTHGRVSQSSEPYCNGGTNCSAEVWNTNAYYGDILGRLKTLTDFKGIVTSYSYVGLVTTITTTPPDQPWGSVASRTDVETRNSLGKMLNIENGKGSNGLGYGAGFTDSNTEFRYDAHGNPIFIKDAAGNAVTAVYNVLDQKTSVNDPDHGDWTYSYDVLGELKTQVDGKSQPTTMIYDSLGRMVSKTAPEGTTTWNYDGPNTACGDASTSMAPPYEGKLRCVVQFDGYQVNYGYDGDSRPDHVREFIGGTGYSTDTSYDTDGRVDTVTYPASVADAPPVVSASVSQTSAAPNTLVTLNGSASDPDNGPQALGYQWQQTSGPTVTLSGGNTATASFTTGAAGNSYSFALTVNDGLVAVTSSTVTVTVPPLPATPTGLTDDGDTDHNGIYVVSWNAVSVSGQTIVYHLEQATGNSSGPTSGYTDIWSGSFPSGTQPTHPVNNATNASYYYYYRVRAHDISGYGGYSSVDGIHVVVIPTPTPTLSPSGWTAVQAGANFTESWTLTTPRTGYELYQSMNDPNFSNPLLEYSGTALSWTTSRGDPNIDFYYRVRACNSSDGVTVCSPYSNVSKIAINGTGGAGNAPIKGGGTTTTSAPSPTTVAAPAPTTTPAPAPTTSTGPIGMAEPAASDEPVNESESTPAAMRPQYALPVYLAYAGVHMQPASGSTPLARFSVRYTYTTSGYMQSIVNGVRSGELYWQANSMNVRGQFIQEQFGTAIFVAHGYDANAYENSIAGTRNGTAVQTLTYTWFSNGDLQKRSASVTEGSTTYNPSEVFQYDVLNRVVTSQVTNGGGTQAPMQYGYDAVGDLKTRTDADGMDTDTYTYGQGGEYPHAVTAVAGTSLNGAYSYDANGNMMVRNTGNVDWNSDDLPICVDVSGAHCASSGANYSQFNYAPDKHRYQQTAAVTLNGITTNETTIYAGGLEIVTKGSNPTEFRHTLTAYGKSVVLDTWTSNSSGNPVETKHFLLGDHLGSVDTVVDSSGNIVPQESFDTFGQRRDPTTWMPPLTGSAMAADRTVTHHGYTGHEELDNVGLIHMNGRVYDPQLGRFLSVDPMFQFPTNGQSINPYSYVLNNPLSLTDPTGYAAEGDAAGECGPVGAHCPTANDKLDTMTGSHINGVNTGASCSGNCANFVVNGMLGTIAKAQNAGVTVTQDMKTGQVGGNAQQAGNGSTPGVNDADKPGTGQTDLHGPQQKGQLIITTQGAPDSFKEDVMNSIDYTNKSGIDPYDTILDQGVNLTINYSAGDNSFGVDIDPKTGGVTDAHINYNPHQGMRVDGPHGKIQSPAMGLLHEGGHIVRILNGVAEIRNGKATEQEENEVIRQFETPAAKALGEPTRQYHWQGGLKGEQPTVSNPTYHNPP